MNLSIPALSKSKMFTGFAAVGVLALSLLVAPEAGALSMASVSPASGATIEITEGETLKLIVTASLQPGEVLHELEVDHSYDNTNPLFPEFSVYANQANPYDNPSTGETGQEAIFTSLGASVIYDASAQQWVLDFGPAITDLIMKDGGQVRFHLRLHGIDTNNGDAPITWGSMSLGTPEAIASTFSYTLALPAVDEEATPGVPNTATARGESNSVLLAVTALAAGSTVGAAAMAGRFGRL